MPPPPPTHCIGLKVLEAELFTFLNLPHTSRAQTWLSAGVKMKEIKVLCSIS